MNKNVKRKSLSTVVKENAAMLQECFVDCKISPDFSSAQGLKDNDWNFIFQ